MEEKGWERKRMGKELEEEREKVLAKVRQEKEGSFIKKDVKIGFTADQFIVRLPIQLSQHIKLNPKKIKEYRFRFIWGAGNPDDKIFKGNFEVIKK